MCGKTFRNLASDYYIEHVRHCMCVLCSSFDDDYDLIMNIDLAPTSLLTTDVYLQAVKLSWIPNLSLDNIHETYTLTVMTNDIQPQILERNETNYVFNAPEGAPPCQVYSFSVTANLVANTATYTGAGCSVPSEPISTMLPTLPNISRMESSVGYVLKKRFTMEFELRVSFMVRNYNYSIKILLLPSMSVASHIL